MRESRLRFVLISLLFLIYSSFLMAVETPSIESNQKTKLQLEDLLIWKISDELKLTPDQEKKVTEIIKTINKKKTENNLEIETLTKQVIKAEDEKTKSKSFNDLKKKLQQHGALASEELELIKSALGIKKLGQYLEVKNDISEKVKNLIIPADKRSGKKLPPPKIIEE